MKMQKKGQVLNALSTLGIGIATLVIVLTVVFLIIGQGQQQVAEIEGIVANAGGLQSNQSSLAINATNTLREGVADLPGWVPLIVIGVIGSILLGLVKLFKN